MVKSAPLPLPLSLGNFSSQYIEFSAHILLDLPEISPDNFY